MESEDEKSVASNDVYDDDCNGLDEYFNSLNRKETLCSDEKKECIYPGLNLLNECDLDDYIKQYESATVNLCTYQLNNINDKPFLQFVLRKYDKTHETKPDFLTFPSFKYKNTESTTEMCEFIENVICATYHINPCAYDYKGFINKENEFYVFYELLETSINVHDLYRTNDLWLVLIDEIVNHRKVCNFSIEDKVVNFFGDNFEFVNLRDENNNYYETPIVGYTGSTNKKLNLISCFGVPKTVEPCLKEPHFYFTDYQNAIRLGGWSEDKVNRGGVVKFALFLGCMSAVINEKPIDLDVEACDSVYIGTHSFSPLWALKNYEQQFPLTCHYIDKTNFGDTWEKNKVYYIL
jgi:hypothetical protein